MRSLIIASLILANVGTPALSAGRPITNVSCATLEAQAQRTQAVYNDLAYRSFGFPVSDTWDSLAARLAVRAHKTWSFYCE